MTGGPEATGDQRFPPWGSLIVTMMLVVIALLQLSSDETPTLVGVIVGYISAYWLPQPRYREGK